MPKVGRPRKFKSPAQLQRAVDKYFKKTGWTTRTVLTADGKNTKQIDHYEPATISGLAVHLGTDRHTINNYKTRYEPEFFPIIAACRALCDQNIEQGALVGKLNPVISKMVLMNDHNRTEQHTLTGGDGNDLTWRVEVVAPKQGGTNPKELENKASEGEEPQPVQLIEPKKGTA